MTGGSQMKTYKGIAYGTIAFAVYVDMEEPLIKGAIREKLIEVAQLTGKDKWVLEELNVEDVWDVTDGNLKEWNG